MNYFKKNFGGVDFLYTYISADNVKHPYVLRCMDKIQNFSNNLPSLSQASSITTFLVQLNDAMEHKRIIPANLDKIDNLWFFAGDNAYINSMLADEDRSTIMQVRSHEMTSLDISNSIQKLENFIQSIPKKVKEIDISSLTPEEQENYLLYIVQDIIFSWQTNGMEIDDRQREEISSELLLIAQMPLEDFYQSTDRFMSEIIQISALEIEDLGLSTTAIKPVLEEYLNNFSQSQYEQFLDYIEKS